MTSRVGVGTGTVKITKHDTKWATNAATTSRVTKKEAQKRHKREIRFFIQSILNATVMEVCVWLSGYHIITAVIKS